MAKRKTEKKDKLYLADIKDVYGAMHCGLQVFMRDGTSWTATHFKITRLHIVGDFTKAED